jgi:hypothetical protein
LRLRFLPVALAALSGACATRAVFRYEPSAHVVGPPIDPDGVAVLELADYRGRKALNHNLKALALIPFVPFSVSHRDYPERTWLDSSPNLNGFLPTIDLAKALATEIEGQALFARCRFVESGIHGERYALRGRLHDCHVAEGYLTYGVSFLSMALHALGLPEGTLRCGLRFDVELVDRRDSSVVWKRKLEDASTRLTWIYASREADIACAMFVGMARSLIPPAVAELRRALATRAGSRPAGGSSP